MLGDASHIPTEHTRTLTDLLFKVTFHFHMPQPGRETLLTLTVSFWPHSALRKQNYPALRFWERAFNLTVAFGKNPRHSENSSL